MVLSNGYGIEVPEARVLNRDAPSILAIAALSNYTILLRNEHSSCADTELLLNGEFIKQVRLPGQTVLAVHLGEFTQSMSIQANFQPITESQCLNDLAVPLPVFRAARQWKDCFTLLRIWLVESSATRLQQS